MEQESPLTEPAATKSSHAVVRMLFDDTMPAIIAKVQTVMRLFGSGHPVLKPGDVIEAVASHWMLGYEGKVPVMGLLEVVSVREEPLRRLLKDPSYGESEKLLEGMPKATSVRARISRILSRHRTLTLNSPVTRVEFRYL